MYTEAELYAGSTKRPRYNKKGKFLGYEHTPLDPGLKAASMRFLYPPSPPPVPKPAEQGNALMASAGKGLRRPESERAKKKTNLAGLRNRRSLGFAQLIGAASQQPGFSPLNIGGFG